MRLTERQLSPVIPGSDRESSYPVGVFEWTAENPGLEPLSVGLMFTWQNLVGHWAGQDRAGGLHNRAFREDALTGVVLAGPDGATDEPWSGTFAIAAEAAPGLRLSTRNRFDADDGADVWADFSADGSLDDVDDPTPSRPGEAIGAALAATFMLAPGEARTVAFSLAWDFPVVEFDSGRRWYRRYTRFFGTTGAAAPAIAAEALANRAAWQAEIDAWQAGVLAAPDRPDWYRAALCNELYYLVDGGSFWADREADGVRRAGARPVRSARVLRLSVLQHA